MKKIVALGVVIALLVAGYGAVWLWAAGQATDYVKSLETADGVTLPRVQCGRFGITGFPFGFDAVCADATIEMNDVTATVARLRASAEVYRPTHVLLFAQSPVTIDDAFTGSRGRLDFTSLSASVRLEGWRIGRASVVADKPVWTDTVLGDREVARAERAEAHLVDEPSKYDAAAGLQTLAQYVRVEALEAPGWSIAAGQGTFEGEITNLPDDVRSYGDGDLLRRWQTADGRYIITSLTGGDAAGAFDVKGTLGLDSTGRAEGQLVLQSRGVVERLEPLFPPEFRNWIVGAQGDDGSYSQTLNISAGVVFSGLVPTGIIPPLY